MVRGVGLYSRERVAFWMVTLLDGGKERIHIDVELGFISACCPLRLSQFCLESYLGDGNTSTMATTLFIRKDDAFTGRTGFDAKLIGIHPGEERSAGKFASLSRKISLKDDFEWREVQNLQAVFCLADIWENFPVEGLKFISAETQAGDEDQRVDILYLRNDGGLYPCELKLGGQSRDTHGQLIRYIADLSYQNVNRQWIIDQRIAHLRRKGNNSEREHQQEEEALTKYFEDHHIDDRHVRVLRNSGIIVDEIFKPQMLKAVRYLNEFCGFSIRLLRLDTYVAENWQSGLSQYLARIDLIEVQ